MDLHLTNKVVFVTGGASGIGKAIVQGAAQEGAIPVIVNRSRERGEKLHNELQQDGKKSLFVQADLSEVSQCERAIRETIDQLGQLDVLVNNAGINDNVELENGSPDAFMQSLQNNLLHYYSLAHFALPHLKKTKGNIINVSSKTAVTGQGGTSGYIASKGAQLALTREWAVELLPYGIRVNAVLPAEVLTPMYKNWLKKFDDPKRQKTEIERRIPLEQRMTTPQEIADTVLFLASDRASHTTGQYLFPDGGYTHLDRAIHS
jgi:L-fucose dehydrogenase